MTPNRDADIRKELKAATNTTEVRPNRVIFGEGAWDMRSDAYDFQNNAGANRAAGLSLEELARKLFVDKVRVMGARYQDASSKTAILGNEIYTFYTKNDIMKDEPANIKRFVTPIDGGSTFRVYVDEHSKFSNITVEHYAATGFRKLTVSAA